MVSPLSSHRLFGASLRSMVYHSRGVTSVHKARMARRPASNFPFGSFLFFRAAMDALRYG